MHMTREQLEKWLDDVLGEEAVLLADGLEEAFVGVGERWHESEDGGATRLVVAVYDIDKCIEVLMRDGMSHEEADEFFVFNTLGAYVGPQTPIFIRRFSHDLEAVLPVSHAQA